MSPETLILVIVLLILFCSCLICWFECCTDIMCVNDTITIEPEVDNPVIEL